MASDFEFPKGVVDPSKSYHLNAAVHALGIAFGDDAAAHKTAVEWVKRHLIYSKKIRARREGNHIFISGAELHRWIQGYDLCPNENDTPPDE